MIYISAQPDDFYFSWQLELLVRNLRSLEVTKDKIHIVIGYKKEQGINPDLERFIDVNSDLAEFYCYPDTRAKDISYVSTIRPHLLKKHFQAHPYLSCETIFYHDSDIIFSWIPKIAELDKDDTCYVSDASRYLNREYITKNGSQELLTDMLKVVGIGMDVLETNDYETGGAQYILKGIDSNFWDKVEGDSEELYKILKLYNEQKWYENYPSKRSYRRTYKHVQAWCADMWAVLYNLWYFNKTVKVHDEMDFSWPNSIMGLWEECPILHYSGDQKNNPRVFDKSRYKIYPPWYDDRLDQISSNTCSYKVLEAIKARKKELEVNRVKLEKVCIVLNNRKDNKGKEGKESIIRRYFQKHIDCSVREAFTKENNKKDLQEGLGIEQLAIKKLLESEPEIEYFIFLPVDSFISSNTVSLIYEEMAVNPDWSSQVFLLGTCYFIDPLYAEAFSELLDENLLERNLNKFHSQSQNERKIIVLKRDIIKSFGNSAMNLDSFELCEKTTIKGIARPALYQL